MFYYFVFQELEIYDCTAGVYISLENHPALEFFPSENFLGF